MTKVRIIQLLCPNRHCIVATAYESPDGAAIPEMTDRLKLAYQAWVTAGANPWCGICHAKTLTPEDSATRWATMDEALPHLQKCAAGQAATREYFRTSRN